MAPYSKIFTPGISFFQLPSPFCVRNLKFGPISWPGSSIPSQAGSFKLSAIMSHGEFDSMKYNWIDGAESLEKYVPGGYHPFMIGDMLHERYSIVHKLAHGGYSTVWLALDTLSDQYVAIKVGIADRDIGSLRREIKSLQGLSTPRTSLPLSTSTKQQHQGGNSIPLVLDEFELHGPGSQKMQS